jgi:hypothetical protein
MGLFERFGLGAARAGAGGPKAPDLPGPEAFFAADALALLTAARAGDESRVRELIAGGVDPNSHGPASTSKATPQLTLLNYATSLHDERALGVLIANGADPLFAAREEDGNAFLFPIVRGDAAGLDMLYKLFPMSRIPPRIQSKNAFSALGFNCRPCLEVMFRHGLPPGVEDVRHYTLFMEALSREDLDMAEWLLADVNVPLAARTSRGVTGPNMVQSGLTEDYRPGTPTYLRYRKLQAIMADKGIAFPVESAAQYRARMNLK